MLKRVGHPVDEKGAAVAIKDATFPVPFAPGLEFNSPVHGNWNADAGGKTDLCLCR